MHKTVILCFAISLLTTLSAGDSTAIQIGKTVEFDGGSFGRVIFDGTTHNQAGAHCMVCHNDIFKTKIGTAGIIWKDHSEGKQYCFACHNGEKAFGHIGNCRKCHKKAEAARP